MLVKLDHMEDEAQNIKTFWLEPEKQVDYVAGQYIEMYLPHENPDARGQKHWFTLSSSPSEKLISITTKQAASQMSTFKQVLFSMKLGAEIKISEPLGDFVLPKDTSIPLVFVAAGMGITPVRSMVKWLKDSGEKRRIQLIYSVRALEEAAFLDLFDAYGLKPGIILSRPDADWSGLTGQLSGERVLKIAGQDPQQLLYVSGPEPLTEKLETELLAAGVAKDKLVLDSFPGYPAA